MNNTIRNTVATVVIVGALLMLVYVGAVMT